MRAEMGARVEVGGELSSTKEVVGRDAVIVPDLQDQHSRLPGIQLLPGERVVQGGAGRSPRALSVGR